jgi:DNA gyrase subunit A
LRLPAIIRIQRAQAQAIIELQFQRLTGMEQQKILDELAEIQRRSPNTWRFSVRRSAARSDRQGTAEVQKDFGDERRTQIIEDTGEIRLEDLVQRRTWPSRSRAAAI